MELPEMPNMRVLLDEFSKVNVQAHVQESDARRKYKQLESEALRARLKLAMEYAGHSEKCATNYRAFQQKVSSPCDCGLTALRERLVSEGLL